jgi:hypothetical protein
MRFARVSKHVDTVFVAVRPNLRIQPTGLSGQLLGVVEPAVGVSTEGGEPEPPGG